jgi:hypothetical protein
MGGVEGGGPKMEVTQVLLELPCFGARYFESSRPGAMMSVLSDIPSSFNCYTSRTYISPISTCT